MRGFILYGIVRKDLGDEGRALHRNTWRMLKIQRPWDRVCSVCVRNSKDSIVDTIDEQEGRAVGNEIRGVIGEGRWYRSPGKDFTFWWDAVRMGCYQYGRVLSRGIAWSDLGFWKVFSIWRKDSRRTRLTSGRSGGWQLTVIQVEGGGGDDLLQGSSWDGGEKWTWTDF